MKTEELQILLNEIEKSGIAQPLITKLSQEIGISESLVKSILIVAIHLINSGSK